MKYIKAVSVLLGVLIFMHSGLVLGQTTTTSGVWTDGSIWNTGVQPTATGTVIVNHSTEINTNLSISSGSYTFNQDATDFAGGTEYSLTMTGGSLTVNSGAVVNFNAACSITDGTITVNAGGTLILRAPSTVAGLSLPNQASLNIYVYGTLIIYGNVENKNNSGTFVVDGILQLRPIPGCVGSDPTCMGNFDNQTGSITVSGTGDLQTSGSLSNNGGSTTFGSSNDCSTGPCSGQSLCLGSGANVISTNQYLCPADGVVGLTGDVVSGASFYQWQSSTLSSTSGFADISGASGATFYNYSPSKPAQTTWYRRVVTSAACTPNARPSLPVVITIIPNASWKGTSDVNWNTPGNWCGSLPTIGDDVVVSAGVPFQPTVSGATVALCKNLTINNGATLTVNSTRQIDISGNLVNNGTVAINGTIRFISSSAQTVSGSGISSFATLTVNNSNASGLTLSSSGTNVATQLNMISGKVDLSAANLTVGTSAGVGTLSYTAGWLYNGNVTRWIGTGALTLGNAPGFFPIGSSSDFRPVYFGNASIATQGTIRASHTLVAGTTNVAFSDNGTAVGRRSNSFWTIATGNSLAETTANTFTLRTEATGIGTVGNVTHLRLIQAASAVGTPGTNAGTTTNPQVNRTALSLANLANNFYWGTTDLVVTPLPIDLISFTGRQQMTQVTLDWATASEKNFDYFEVERSTDATDFISVGRLNGQGTSNVGKDYRLIDEKPLIGKNYYRLKSVDFDGYTEYFKIIAIDVSAEKSFKISPNPSDGTALGFSLNFSPGGNSSIMVFDNLGNVIGLYQPSGYSQRISFADQLKAGVYYAKIVSDDFVKVERFVVR